MPMLSERNTLRIVKIAHTLVWAFFAGSILVIPVYSFMQEHKIALSHKSMNIGAVLVGGAFFGCGWAVMGFCPGTSIGALGEGRWHAIFAIAGMVVGAAVYAELYPIFKSTVLAWKDLGKIGVADVMGISPWLVILVFWAGSIWMFLWFERKKL